MGRAELAYYVKLEIKRQRKTQKQVAEKTGFTESELSRMLSGKHNFTIDSLLSILKTLNVKLIIID